jgi:GDP-4-dehydro-6-deoxy-D-mannose reductase
VERRVLITGAQGFLGRYVAADWLEADGDAAICGIGRSEESDSHFTHTVHWGERRVRAPLHPQLAGSLRSDRYRYQALDMTDSQSLTELMAELRPSHVIHLAAALRDDPTRRLVEANIVTVVSLFESISMAEIPPPRVVLGSSGSIYGMVPGSALPIREDTICAPTDPYAATKNAAEELGGILAARHGVVAIRARIFNPVGPGQDERHLCGWLGRQVAAIAGQVSPPTVSVGPLHTTRDFIDVRDTARALRLLATRGEPGTAYNVASGEETSGQRILDLMLNLSGLAGRVSLQRLPPRRVDVDRVYADINRLKGLGYEPRFRLDESLADVLSYYRECGSTLASIPGR